MTSTLSMQVDGINMTLTQWEERPSIHMRQQMTTKVAPAYAGITSFFAFEDAIDDWCDIAELEPEKRGPALRNRNARRNNTRGYWIEKCSGIPTMVSTISKDSCDPISLKVPRTCSYTVSCSSWSTTEEPWIFKNGWLDFNWLAMALLSLEWIFHQIWWLRVQMQVHSLRNVVKIMKHIKLKIAAATPGQDPHVIVPWTDEHALIAFRLISYT